MAIENGFESGVNNDALTPANSGFSTIVNTGGTSVISTAWAFQGTRSGLFTGTSTSGACYGQESLAGLNTSFSIRFFLRIDTMPSASPWIFNLLRDASQRMSIELTTTGALRIRDDAQANIYTSGNLGTATVYRVEFFCTQSPTTGTCRLTVYSANTMTVVEDSGLLSNRNTGSDEYNNFRLGAKTSTGTVTLALAMDNWAYNENSAAYVGPYGTPPVAGAGANQDVAASVTVNLSGTATDADGTVTSTVWTFDYPTSGAPSLTGGTTLTPSFTSGSAGNLYILRLTATDNDTFTHFDTMEVRVPLGGAVDSLPLAGAGTGAGSWSNVGGAGSEGEAMADGSDATYVQSSTLSGTPQLRRFRVQPSDIRATSNVEVRMATDTGTGNTTVRLYQGATLRQTWTQAITTTITTYSFALSGGTITAIGSDWGDLYIEVEVTS